MLKYLIEFRLLNKKIAVCQIKLKQPSVEWMT